MPYYDYQCSRCRCRFDRFAKSMTSSDGEPSPTCPRCASDDTRRVISRVAIARNVGPGIGASAYPTSWSATNHGDLESIHYWRSRVEKEQAQEARDPGLARERLLNAQRRYSAITEHGSPVAPPSSGPAPEAHRHDHDHSHGSDSPSHPPVADTREPGHAHAHGPGASAD